MDSVTQAALGATMGELVLGKKLGGKALAWGALFGTLPDLDILYYPWLDKVERLYWHRGLSHSILLMVIMPLLLAPLLTRLHRKRGLQYRETAWFIFLAWSTHVLIDVFTSYGTQILEPFSSQRFSTNNLFIIDLFFTLPLLLSLILCPWFNRESIRRRRINITLLIISGLYVAFSFAMKGISNHKMRENLPPGASLVATSPTLSNVLLWRGLAESPDEFHVSYWSLFDDTEQPIQWISLTKNHHHSDDYLGEPTFESLVWFSRDLWVTRKDSNGNLVFIDMRFGEIRDTTNKQLLPTFQWTLEKKSHSTNILQERPTIVNPESFIEILMERIRGEDEKWNDMEPF